MIMDHKSRYATDGFLRMEIHLVDRALVAWKAIEYALRMHLPDIDIAAKERKIERQSVKAQFVQQAGDTWAHDEHESGHEQLRGQEYEMKN